MVFYGQTLNRLEGLSQELIVLIIDKDKKLKGKVLLINGSKHFENGQPKDFLTEEEVSH